MAFPVRLPCITVTQPIGTFYIAVMKAGDLLSRLEVMQRGLDPERQRNVQRELAPSRVQEISNFTLEPDATFPTSIIVSAYPEFVRASADGGSLLVGRFNGQGEEPNDIDERSLNLIGEHDTIGQVIDGQHRIAGLREAGAGIVGSPIHDFELPVVFMLDLDDHDRAYIFSTINSKQTRVQSSLIYDLFGLARYRSPKKTCHDVASALNAKSDGPFFRVLKMLGKKNNPSESLTQGSFSAYLLPHITRTADTDESALKAGRKLAADPRCIFRKYFLEDRDEFIVYALGNYFSAVKQVYPNAWANPGAYALRRTVGFAALMKALETVWTETVVPAGEPTLEVFLSNVSRFPDRVPEGSLREIKSSGGAAVALAKQFLGRE